MEEILKFISTSENHFVGFFILFLTAVLTITFIFNRLFIYLSNRSKNLAKKAEWDAIAKHGYPPKEDK